ncbi:hypothetical protein [Gaiella sp.]|uniref:hypothetical protein n=1 Tax=Gaiella sp. TaxID=2663207 RepID=UPI003266A5E2
MRRPAVAWAGLALALVLLAIGATLSFAGRGDDLEVLASIVLVGPFAFVGGLVAARQPQNPIGWLLEGIGLALAVARACDSAIDYGLAHPGQVPSLGSFALVSSLAFAGFFALLILVLVLLPNGRLPSRRWRFVLAGLALLVAIDLASIVRPGLFDDWDQQGIRNPLGIEALGALFSALNQALILLTFLLLLLSIVSVVVRFRRSTGVERAQLRWIASAVAATGIGIVTMLIGSAILGDRRASDILWGAAIVSISFIPIGIGIAVMRYRLYEIDRVISRTLVYAVVTVVLASAYVGLVLIGQALFSSFAGGSNLAIAASTLVVAALFLPVRSRVQGFVDRRFNRRRYDAQRTLEAFGARLREQIDLATLETDLKGVVTETMQPTHTSVWLRTGASS